MATSKNTATADECDRTDNVNDEEVESWVPICKEELICKMKKTINELERSRFYDHFREEVQRKPISEGIRSVLGSESKLQMVIYGIGSINSNEEDECPKWQLSLAILMKKDFNWIGEVEVFDPILSDIEIQVLESFGCTVISINEHGRRQALKPTMFFMPHCDQYLYNNLLEANWRPELLSNVIIFGNSFDSYIEDFAIMSRLFYSNDRKRRLCTAWGWMGHILAAQAFTNEFDMMRRISCDPPEIGQSANPPDQSFSNLKWHFFNPLTAGKMRLMRENSMKEHCVYESECKIGRGRTTCNTCEER